MKKKVLLINCNPKEKSLSFDLMQACRSFCEKTFIVDVIDIKSLVFEKCRPIESLGQNLEDDILRAQELISKSDHVILFTPVYWGYLPSLAHAFFERVFITGFSHQFNIKTMKVDKLLTGKTATVVYSMGANWFYDKVISGSGFFKNIKNSIFSFIGFHKVDKLPIHDAHSMNEGRFNDIKNKIFKMINKI